jgi:hypothetical protein
VECRPLDYRTLLDKVTPNCLLVVYRVGSVANQPRLHVGLERFGWAAEVGVGTKSHRKSELPDLAALGFHAAPHFTDVVPGEVRRRQPSGYQLDNCRYIQTFAHNLDLHDFDY